MTNNLLQQILDSPIGSILLMRDQPTIRQAISDVCDSMARLKKTEAIDEQASYCTLGSENHESI